MSCRWSDEFTAIAPHFRVAGAAVKALNGLLQYYKVEERENKPFRLERDAPYAAPSAGL